MGIAFSSIKRLLSISILVTLVLFLLPGPSAAADDPDRALPEILSAAESLFLAMKHRDYPAVWRLTTAASKAAIVNDTFRAIEGSGGKPVPKEEIRRDFDASGPISSRYWDGFLERFDPDLVLERSRWEKGRIDPDSAEILITGKAASMPARLKLFREDGGWKVGLAETFWGRKD